MGGSGTGMNGVPCTCSVAVPWSMANIYWSRVHTYVPASLGCTSHGQDAVEIHGGSAASHCAGGSTPRYTPETAGGEAREMGVGLRRPQETDPQPSPTPCPAHLALGRADEGDVGARDARSGCVAPPP